VLIKFIIGDAVVKESRFSSLILADFQLFVFLSWQVIFTAVSAIFFSKIINCRDKDVIPDLTNRIDFQQKTLLAVPVDNQVDRSGIKVNSSRISPEFGPWHGFRQQDRVTVLLRLVRPMYSPNVTAVCLSVWEKIANGVKMPLEGKKTRNSYFLLLFYL